MNVWYVAIYYTHRHRKDPVEPFGENKSALQLVLVGFTEEESMKINDDTKIVKSRVSGFSRVQKLLLCV